MILLEITPLSKPVAISEMLILLAAAAFIGWLIGKWVTNGRVNILRSSLADKKDELSDCREKAGRLSFTDKQSISARDTLVADNLKVIEGIGPKIEQLLHRNGILTLGQLAETSASRMSEILRANPRFQMHDPTTWPQQAALARDGKWDELGELQDRLDGGRLV
ncbi:hypothetical protein DYBT9275_05257 [Dyadobacter sp. CECT 9275]|uniref:DUF4332 domain-containing protein n=1 Tax=Dyadobacter helix TaxID=2822344 RepID=A0A916JGU4_9BACT|nr:hypothetical protein [Dyadobacter sp. CECT 9275]CAG5012836.1 hypothetical protein DYBT9275_05257 [Dyadobacter sp. CECT 9275]